MKREGGACQWQGEGELMKREVGLGSGDVKEVQNGGDELREVWRWRRGKGGRENSKGLRR